MKVGFVHFGRENLGIEYLSSMLKKQGHEVFLAYDPGLFSREDNALRSPLLENFFSRRKRVVELIGNNKPGLVAFSVYTTTYQWALALAEEIKRKFNLPVLFGGIHPTLVPGEVIRHEFIDFLIVGEAEFALLELAQALEDKLPFSGIKNLWYKEGGSIRKNELREPIEDLDSLPFPDKEIFESHIRYKDDYMIMASRGCPFDCSYCCESYLNELYCRKYFRRRSPESVMSELSYMKERYDFKEVMFFDSILFTDKTWLKELMLRFKKEIGVPFRCTGHVAFVDEEAISCMKAGGCYCVNFGVQSLNEPLRKAALNRHEPNKKIKQAFDACDKFGLRYDVDLMFGLPGTAEQDYKLPIDFMKDSKCLNRLKCFYLSYYPKLSIVDKAKEAGVLNDADIKNIENGKAGDWFHVDSIKEAGHKRWKENFSRIYKIYPILPKFLKNIVARKKIYKWFYLVPNFFIVALQALIGVKNRDYRFKIYINKYLHSLRAGPRSLQ